MLTYNSAQMLPLPHNANGGLRPNAVDRGQQLAHLVLGQALLDVALSRVRANAGAADRCPRTRNAPAAGGLAIMRPHRLCGR
jgi:hypothetical protein